MPLSQGQKCQEGFYQPQPKHEVVAAVTDVTFRRRPASPCRVDQYEELAVYHASDAEAELPPYESVSVGTFVAVPDVVSGCISSKVTHLCSTHGLCQSMAQGYMLAANKDFILFPIGLECSSEQASSVVSCFADDVSSSGSTVTSSCDSSNQSPMASQQVSENLLLDCCSRQGRRGDGRTSALVSEWLSNTNRDIACGYVEELSPDQESASTGQEPDESARSRAIGKAS